MISKICMAYYHYYTVEGKTYMCGPGGSLRPFHVRAGGLLARRGSCGGLFVLRVDGSRSKPGGSK